MRKRLRQSGAAFVSGLFFAIGLGVAGMTQPQRVIGFLDIQSWDPTLLFVMAGAVGLHAVTYQLIRRRSRPLFDHRWHVPAGGTITRRLFLGAAIFGFGWALGGFCPGPALVGLVTGDQRVFVFFVMMLIGMGFMQWLEKWRGSRHARNLGTAKMAGRKS